MSRVPDGVPAGIFLVDTITKLHDQHLQNPRVLWNPCKPARCGESVAQVRVEGRGGFPALEPRPPRVDAPPLRCHGPDSND